MTERITRVGIVAKHGLLAASEPLTRLASWLDQRQVSMVFEAATAALTELPMVNSASGLRPLVPPIETNEPRRSFRSGQAARTSRIWPKNFSA